MVDDRYMMYKETYKAYKEAEERYLNLLFNIERMPEEEELWIMKREQMQELMQLRELMLQARGELDDAMKDWESHLMEVQAEAEEGARSSSTIRRGGGGAALLEAQLNYSSCSKPPIPTANLIRVGEATSGRSGMSMGEGFQLPLLPCSSPMRLRARANVSEMSSGML